MQRFRRCAVLSPWKPEGKGCEDQGPSGHPMPPTSGPSHMAGGKDTYREANQIPQQKNEAEVEKSLCRFAAFWRALASESRWRVVTGRSRPCACAASTWQQRTDTLRASQTERNSGQTGGSRGHTMPLRLRMPASEPTYLCAQFSPSPRMQFGPSRKYLCVSIHPSRNLASFVRACVLARSRGRYTLQALPALY